jgi:hypothetical protein
MRLPIRPGKVACAGVVVIFLVLPNSIWKGADAKDAPVAKRKVESIKKARESDRSRVKFQQSRAQHSK